MLLLFTIAKVQNICDISHIKAIKIAVINKY